MGRLTARASRVRLALLGIALCTLAWAVPSYAWDRTSHIDLESLAGGLSITPRAELLLDESHGLRFERVSSPPLSDQFRPTGGELALGLEPATLWLRFEAANRSPRPKDWLLELAYPHLDCVTLYVQRRSGAVERYETGDMVPFARRPIAQPNFLFPLENEGGETTAIYLEVSTTGTLSLPLTAWNLPELVEHQSQLSTSYWIFFGALLMMAVYNVAVFVLIRQGEYLTQALLLVAMCAATFAFNGLMFQHVFPQHPQLANKAIGFFLLLGLSACMLTCSQVARRVQLFAWYGRPFAWASSFAFGVAMLVALAPKEVGLRLAVAVTGLYLALGAVVLVHLTRRNHPQLRLYLFSWYFPIIGVPITLLVNFGALPPWALFSSAAYIGCALQAVLTSLALAARVKVMGDHLASLNEQLSDNVVNLERALDSAREAHAAAQRATKAKDEFLATVSHELRTPLNAIINVPQGLLEDFAEESAVRCERCNASFVPEDDDDVDAMSCPDCGARDTWRWESHPQYVGEPARSLHFLRKIERAGQHLLHTVNGVLDFSKLAAGRLDLTLTELDLEHLVHDVADAMSELARQKSLSISVQMSSRRTYRRGDPVRLKQVLLNLVSNAIKFSEQGGVIQLSVQFDGQQEADIIRVSDQGIGIAPENHERIFQDFEQVHAGSNRRYGGTGLGLSISRKLVRMHGGELWVESELGQGSTFVVRLPRGTARAVG